jgi:uncharacterized protein (DUF302 family)
MSGFNFDLNCRIDAENQEKMMNIESNHSVDVTLDRLEAILKEKGIGVVARINHAAAAQAVGEELRPTELLLFGNPKLGTPLMQANQEAGFDLPMKALAWQDASGKTWLRVTNPALIKSQNSLNGVDGNIEKMTMALSNMAAAAVAA